MTDLLNFRDFGGARTDDGGVVRRGLLFRSGHMGGLSVDAEQALLSHDVALVIDLRYRDERIDHPTPVALLANVVAHDGASAREAPHLAVMRDAIACNGSIDGAYDAFYTSLPFDPYYRPLFGRAVTAIANAGGPALIHCTAGKDRTGVLSAVVLAALGVPDAAIVEDYLRTNGAPGMGRLREQVVARFAGRDLAAEPALVEALLSVKPAFLAASLATIRDRCGSVEEYLLTSGVTTTDLDVMRDRLVERRD